ncbi:RES family NAD+ phosphorylase [Cupriavidus gilardii]|uniref:RES family NAD+ phosphorylase n=1 Tax=Cupriavidus gilardii TaxID=82541 RepID=UPI001ABED35B|nr:RES family NAD+ phosphorylase [Cupriavidus gilardii]MBO4120672.1 RES family NAD+ phosphorylase [Cupriavidus gilardii]
MLIYRIADRRHEVWNGTGAMLVGGRFNSPGRPVIYGAPSFAGAMLEVLVHTRTGKVPRQHVVVVAEAPEDIAAERAGPNDLPAGWDKIDDPRKAREFGDRWLTEMRSAILLVPSVVAGREWNALINPMHPDAATLSVSPPEPVRWDERLFRTPEAGKQG